MSKSIEEFLKYAESRMSEIEMYDALIKEAMYKEAINWSKANPFNWVRRVTNPKWQSTYDSIAREHATKFLRHGKNLGELEGFLKKYKPAIERRVNSKVGNKTNWEFGYKAPAPKAPTTPSPTPVSPGSPTTPSPAPAAAATTKTTPAPAPELKPAGTEDVKVPGSEATKDPNLKWKAIGLGGIPATATLTWLGTSGSSDLEAQNDSLVKQVNDYQQQIQQMRDSAQVGDSFANMNFFERLLFLLLGPAMFKYMGSGSSNL